MIGLDQTLAVLTLLVGVLNALLLFRVLRTLARLDRAADGVAQGRRQARHAYAAWLLSQMRPARTPPPPRDTVGAAVIDLGEAVSWPRRFGDGRS